MFPFFKRVLKCLVLVLSAPHPVLLQASNGQWYQMNDSLVHSSNIKVVLNQQAYVLFYLRYECSAPPPLPAPPPCLAHGPPQPGDSPQAEPERPILPAMRVTGVLAVE